MDHDAGRAHRRGARRRLVAAPSVPWGEVPEAARAFAGRKLQPVSADELADHAEDVVIIDRAAHHGSAAQRSAALTGLVHRGLAVLLPDPMSVELRDRLGEPLADSLTILRPDHLDDEEAVARAAAVAHRRVLLADGHPPVTVLAPTRRPDHLTRLSRMLARQVAAARGDVQVVVGLHGDGFGSDPAGTIRRSVADASVVACDPRMPFGAVLQALTDRADGEVLVKLDDDDMYADEHVAEMAATVRAKGVEVTGRAAEFVHLTTADVTIRRRFGVTTGAADSVAGGTITVEARALAEAGGWPPVRTAVDRALLDRLRAADAAVHRAPPFGYLLVRHGDGHTWRATDRWFLADAVREWSGCATDVVGVTAADA